MSPLRLVLFFTFLGVLLFASIEARKKLSPPDDDMQKKVFLKPSRKYKPRGYEASRILTKYGDALVRH